MNPSLISILLVAIGGALGSVSRYSLSLLITNNFSKGSSFPLATISVNILGSFLVGVLYYITINHLDNLSLQVRLFLIVGFLGGFTTFSAFSLDIFRLLHAGQTNVALSYAALSVILSILAVYLGFYLTSLLAKF